MKHVFFFGLLVLLPVIVLGGGIAYLVWHTCYALYDDWRLNRELREIRAVCQARRREQAAAMESAGETIDHATDGMDQAGGEVDQAADSALTGTQVDSPSEPPESEGA